jgi:hypothetical protein
VEPNLLATCRQVRHEALKFYYLENTFRIVAHDFHPRVLFHLQGHLNAANIEYNKFWTTAHAHVFSHGQLHPQNSWRNLKYWLRLSHHEGQNPSGFPAPHAISRAMRKARGWHVIGGMFHLTHQLWNTEWSVVERILDEQRLILARVINRRSVHDQSLIPLASTPPTASSSSSTQSRLDQN